MLENNNGQYGGKNITVTPNQLQNEYTLYKHKTSAINSITKTFVLYNRRPITLIDNDKFRGSQRLTSTTIQNSKFKEISTYSRSTSQSEHLLIRLTNDTNTHHYLKRFSQDGIQWRQLSIEEIKEHPFIAASGEEDIKDENLETLLEDSKKTKKLLDWIGVQLKGSLVILLDKKDKEDYADAVIEEAISALEPKKDFNAFKLNNKKITVSEKTLDDGQCISLYSYKVLVYDLDEVTTDISESLDIRFLIPTDSSSKHFSEVKLYKMGDQKSLEVDYKHYDKVNNVCVYFYGDGVDGSDQALGPACCVTKDEAYRAKTKDDHDATIRLVGQGWVKDRTTSKCLCTNGSTKLLLNAVTGVVGFLNQVDLSQHPNGTSSEAESQQCTTGTTSGEGVAAATCQADGTTSCTYEVDKFQGKPIKVQVKCEPFNGSNGPTCYKKLTHQPIGMSGATSNANGFRLGDVEYCDNGDSGSRRTGKIEYYPDGSNGDSNVSTQNKYNPLVKVHAYFYNADTKYSDPLLVVLEFSRETCTDDNIDRDYLATTIEDTSLKQRWLEGGGSNLVTMNELHKLTSISDKTQYQIAGLKLFIPQNLPEQSATPSSIAPDQEISLYNIKSNEETVKDKVSNGTSFAEIRSDLDSYTPIYYGSCMGDLYVYFYVGTKTDESTSGDPRPGLICLNNKAYRPLKLPKLKEENYDYKEDKIIELLTEIYFGSSIMKFLHEHVVELSGGGGGLLCLVGSIVGAILVFKKVTASTAVVAAAATAASL
ncbi:hypothetical protein MACK_001101 [Theileria orientalis]|uniref:Uncharacterized protein n=1 Tax=Theileria orientalis TaxID=68886 RepID=A0A976MBU4_THEOR|nr:hypothetical protein MACK_001101 [Theileria orientalis]